MYKSIKQKNLIKVLQNIICYQCFSSLLRKWGLKILLSLTGATMWLAEAYNALYKTGNAGSTALCVWYIADNILYT